jgi:excisionase family DNA binding protein
MSPQRTGLSDWEVGPLPVKPKIAWKMLGCSNTRGYELIAAGELDSFRDGRSRKITVESIRQYVARRLAPTVSLAKDTLPRRRGRPRKTVHGAGAHAT